MSTDADSCEISGGFVGFPSKLKNKIVKLITELTDCGFESMLVVVELAGDSTAQYGSQLGRQFLRQKNAHASQDFHNFCSIEETLTKEDDAHMDISDDSKGTEPPCESLETDYENNVLVHDMQIKKEVDALLDISGDGKVTESPCESSATDLQGITEDSKGTDSLCESPAKVCHDDVYTRERINEHAAFTEDKHVDEVKIDSDSFVKENEPVTSNLTRAEPDILHPEGIVRKKYPKISLSEIMYVKGTGTQENDKTGGVCTITTGSQVLVSGSTNVAEHCVEGDTTVKIETDTCIDKKEPYKSGNFYLIKWAKSPNRRKVNAGSLNHLTCKFCLKYFTSKKSLKKHFIAVHRKKYICGTEGCTSSFKFKHMMNKHKKDYHKEFLKKNQPFVCVTCGKGFLLEQSLASHIKFRHSAGKSKQCDICHKSFRSHQDLRNHRNRHSEAKNYTCEICGIGYKHRSSIFRHRRSQHGSRVKFTPKKYKCEVCHKCYTSKSNLDHHIVVTNHVSDTQSIDKIKLFECESCGKRFGMKTKCDHHVNIVHKKTIVCTCSVCGRGFRDKCTYKAHLLTHSGYKYACHICPKSFRTKLYLEKHMEKKVHNQEGSLSLNNNTRCDICGIGYKTESGLIEHKRGHNGPDKFRCEVCVKVLSSKLAFLHHVVVTNHLTADQTLDAIPVFECDVCGKKFAQRPKMTRHYNMVHKKVTVCTCHVCGKNFTSAGNFTQHLRIHTGGKPTCHICNTSFRSNISLERHMEQNHAASLGVEEESASQDAHLIPVSAAEDECITEVKDQCPISGVDVAKQEPGKISDLLPLTTDVFIGEDVLDMDV